jgi:hypothetical protein
MSLGKKSVTAATLLLGGGLSFLALQAVGQVAPNPTARPNVEFAPADAAATVVKAGEEADLKEADLKAAKAHLHEQMKWMVQNRLLSLSDLDRLESAEHAGATAQEFERLTKQLEEIAHSDHSRAKAVEIREEWERQARRPRGAAGVAMAILGILDAILANIPSQR